MRKLLTVLALGLALTGCAAKDAPDPKPNLLGEYVRATDVRNDRVPSVGSGADRMANIAAHYDVEQFTSRLLSAFPCTEGAGGGLFDTSCDLNSQVTAQADGEIHGRVILVKHDDESLELLTVFVSGGRLIDSTGRTYTSLEDFRADNELLSSDDVIMAPREILKVPGEGEIVTVYGHTGVDWTPWLVAAGGLVVLVVVVAVVVRRRRVDPAPAHHTAYGTTESTEQ